MGVIGVAEPVTLDKQFISFLFHYCIKKYPFSKNLTYYLPNMTMIPSIRASYPRKFTL